MYIFSKLNKNCYYYYYYYYYYSHNYNKILKSDWLSTAVISALIGHFKVIPWFCTAHLSLRITRWPL